jgi:uncharacterized protein YecE (DUF72 family)
MINLDVSVLPSGLRIGTSSFSSTDWLGGFYPLHLSPGQFLSYYAQILSTVEIDATWYAMPSQKTIASWGRRVSDGFVFSFKVPKVITHEHYLENCETEWRQFLNLLEPLERKRGPLLFQFPYIPKRKDPEEYRTGKDFRRRLEAFIPLLPPTGKYVVEIRNAAWIDEQLMDLLRTREIAFCLTAYYTMPSPARLLQRINPVTADFGYVRFLGHHRQMDQLVKQAQEERGKMRQWDELLLDRTRETDEWVQAIRFLTDQYEEMFVYFNNHFAGFAPGSVDLFLRRWGQSQQVSDF